MDKVNFYEQLKMSLESPEFNQKYLEMAKYGDEVQKNFLIKSIYFLIGTRDFTGFNYFFNHSYNDFFPYEYLKENKHFSKDESQKLMYNNLCPNGCLFHVTQSRNVPSVIENGLQTLNDYYHCDFYQKSMEVNRVYSSIRARNTRSINLFSVPYLIEVPGCDLDQSRFNTVYLSYDLNYVLKTYGIAGELPSLFITNLLLALRESGFDLRNQNQLKKYFLSKIKDYDIKIKAEEIKVIFDYIDLIYKDIPSNSHSTKAIVLVPTEKVNSSLVNSLYCDSNITSSVENLVKLKNSEIENIGSIEPSSIAGIISVKESQILVKIKQSALK